MLRPGVDASEFCSVVSPGTASAGSRCTPRDSGTHFDPVDPRLDPRAGRVAVRPADPSGDASAAPARVSRLLAARLLDRNLVRIGRAGTIVDRRLAPCLERLRSGRLYRPLGYVRLGDYLTERLGMSLRRCQAILRLERVVAALPGLGLALESGEVSLSKVETLAGIATAANETVWLERARRLTVRDLRQAVREGGQGEHRAAVPAAGESSIPPGPDGSVTAAGQSIEQEEPCRLISIAAPAAVVGIWHWTLDLVRRVAGRQEPAWRCAEYLAAEFLSGVPESPLGGRRAEPCWRTGALSDVPSSNESAVAVAPGSDVAPSAVPEASGEAAWGAACEALHQALASIGSAADIEAIMADPPAVGDDETDAWDLDALLRRLVRLRQSLSWRQGRLLAAFASLRLHRELGFATLDEWIEDRLPMSSRRARYLMSLDRRMRDLPLLADAYRRGLVSWSQACLLVRVVAPSTQARWIRYARQVTVRRLEDAVVACEIEPAVTAHVGASPIPPTESSPPGDDGAAAGPASLHTSAPERPDTAGPLPVGSSRHRCRRISFWAPLGVAAIWDSALRACRAAAGARLDDWECFLLLVQSLRATWDNPDDSQWKRRYRVFERDGWRCMAPGCTSRSALNEHHIVFRSQQGNDDDDNLVTLCIGHHQEGLHAGHLRCFGRAPHHLWWDLGTRPGGEPLARYFGERLVTRRPYAAPPARAAKGAA